jgi:hypothetical protein
MGVLSATVAALGMVLAASEAAPHAPWLRLDFMVGDLRGEARSSFSRISFDREHGELFVSYGAVVTVYQEALETYRFNVDATIGAVNSVAVLGDGGLLVLSITGELYRCNYRGRLLGQVTFSGGPPGLERFKAKAVQHVKGRTYLLEAGGLRVLVVDADGSFVALRDLAPAMGKDRNAEHDIRGFHVDEEGNLLFTIPAEFKAYVVSPKGEVRSFGTPGSRPGRFNVVGPIARDEHGVIYVGDLLRGVIMLFDQDFNFLIEVGGGGWLVAPSNIAVGNGRLFVAQGGKRGVAVFRVERRT